MPHSLFEILASAAASVATLGMAGWFAHQEAGGPASPAAETVIVAPGTFEFQKPGEFVADGRQAAAPHETTTFARPVEIMKYQVSLADYRRCVDAGACKRADAVAGSPPDGPATGVSYDDAQAYAAWYTRETGTGWRLPSAAEWAYVAAERFAGDVFTAASDPDNPAVAWIRRYYEEAALARAPDPQPKQAGFYGANTNGLQDISGNVWEWTSTCYVRTTLSADGAHVEQTLDNCGVRVAEGRHRAYMSVFVRDGRSGGCAVGKPPDNLGFRLVREPRSPFGLVELWRRLDGFVRNG